MTQILRGVAAVPASVNAPRQGKWWSEVEGRWVYTDLPKEAESLKGVPDDDRDLLGSLEDEIDEGSKRKLAGGAVVADMYYYDILDVDSTAEASAIKRRYYVLARMYHPDKVGHDDLEAAEKFKQISEAYQVLCDPDLRARYDRDGRGGLSADKTSVAEGGAPKLDPAILFAFLFGSDKFNDYIGRLATATSASIGDSPKLDMVQARLLQQRRVTRLAVKLAQKLQPWVDGDHDLCKTLWSTEAAALSTASYGIQLVHTIGKVSIISVSVAFSATSFLLLLISFSDLCSRSRSILGLIRLWCWSTFRCQMGQVTACGFAKVQGCQQKQD